MGVDIVMIFLAGTLGGIVTYCVVAGHMAGDRRARQVVKIGVESYSLYRAPPREKGG